MELGLNIPNWELLPIFDAFVPSVEDYKGKPLLILFFNLGCPGCKGRALPFANRIVLENAGKIDVMGIHTRFEGIEYKLEDFQKAKEDCFIRWSFYKDDAQAGTFYKYKAGGTPHWILLNAEGRLEYSIFGSDPNNALLRLDLKINELLNV